MQGHYLLGCALLHKEECALAVKELDKVCLALWTRFCILLHLWYLQYICGTHTLRLLVTFSWLPIFLINVVVSISSVELVHLHKALSAYLGVQVTYLQVPCCTTVTTFG
jgi:predicted membrane-bound dolichyl-phosphate-mannose-protein mannosyltransferase